MLQALWFQRIGTKAAFLVLFVIFEVAFKPLHMGLTFEGKNMGADPVKEEAIVGNDHGTAGEVYQSIFKRTQGFHVQIVGRFIEQQHIAAGLQQTCHVNTVALTT